MIISGGDGRLADGSEHSLGLYHSGWSNRNAIVELGLISLFGFQGKQKPIFSFASNVDQLPSQLPGQSQPRQHRRLHRFPSKLLSSSRASPHNHFLWPNPTPPQPGHLPGAPRPLPALPHLLRRISTFNRRPHCAPAHQCNEGNNDDDDGGWWWWQLMMISSTIIIIILIMYPQVGGEGGLPLHHHVNGGGPRKYQCKMCPQVRVADSSSSSMTH